MPWEKGDSPLFYTLIILALKKGKGKKGTVPFFPFSLCVYLFLELFRYLRNSVFVVRTSTVSLSMVAIYVSRVFMN